MNGKMQLIYLFRIRDLNLLYRLQNLNEILKDFSQVLPNGIPTFVGSCRGDVSIEIINNRNEFYINTIYKVTNTTSATSFFYHLMPSWSSGYPMGNWTQVYIWKEKIKCCKK